MKKQPLTIGSVRGPLLLILILSGIAVYAGCTKSPRSIDNLNTEQEFEKFNELFKEGKPFYTIEEATDIADELIPRIEALAGKKFITRPHIRLIDTATAASIFKQQAFFRQTSRAAQYQNHFSKKEEKLFQIISKTIGGIYEPKHKRLNLVPTHIEPMLRLMQLGYRQGMRLAKMTIAHELTHALQDQHIDLDKKIQKAPGAEERYAFAAAIEGHANFIQRAIGKQLGLNYYKADANTDLQFKNLLLRKATSVNSPYVLKYTKGTQFIKYHFEKGGNRHLWDILETPPVDISMILYPETYRPAPYDTFNYQAILADIYDFSSIDKNTKKIPFEYNNFSLSKFSIMALFSDLNMPDKEYIISKIGHYQTVLVLHNDVVFAIISFIIMKSEQYTDQYIALEQKHVTQKAGTPFLDMHSNYLCEKDSIKIAKEITTHEKLKTWYEQGTLVKRKYAILAKKNLIVTYSDIFFWLEDCELLKIAEKIFTRYENNKQKEKNHDPGEHTYTHFPRLQSAIIHTHIF